MGAGKTRAILHNVEQLYHENLVDLLIVIAPNGVHPGWITRQAKQWLTVDFEGLIWSSKHNNKNFRLRTSDVLAHKGLKIIAMNVEALSTRGSGASKLLISAINRCQFGAFLVVDESTTIKSPKANRSKEIAMISWKTKYRRILTGTPSTESPFDLWMQFEVMKKNFWGRGFYMFRQRYGEFITRRFGTRAFEEVVGYRNIDELKEMIAPYSSEVIKSECLDLPPKTYTVVEVELTREQKTHYKQMLNYYTTVVANEEVVTDTPLARLQKLHQIVTGHIITEEGEPLKIPHNRMTALKQTLDTLTCKAIIFCQYVQPIKEIMDELGDKAVEYSGRTSHDDRQHAIERFQHDDAISYIVISLQSSGAYGLDLYAAGAVIYYCNGYSLERRMQSEDRAHRPGQEHDCVSYIDLVTPGTVDEQVQQSLAQKIDVASQITKLMASWLRPR
jgi:SNF2 family DNA or RNA helicase